MIEINLNNLEKNVRELTKDGRQLIGVVKNNAYGCGAVKISEHLLKCKVEYLLVNDIIEANQLLSHGINANIIIFNGIKKCDYEMINKYPNLVISLNSLQDCLSLNEHCDAKIRLHIQIDTGLNRLGIKDIKEYLEVLKILKSNDKFIIEGIFTHFASPEHAIMQLEKFKAFVNMYDYKIVHCVASSTYDSISYGNFVRCGLALYDLNPVMNVRAYPLAIREVVKGETIGYGFEYTADEDMLIAILPVGYGNGYRLQLKDFKVYANGSYYQVIGRICMNHIFAKVDSKVTLETLFTLMGDNLLASEVANYLNTSKYEVYTSWKFNQVKYLQ